MHLILAPLYNLLHDDTFFHWIEEHESVFIFKNLTHTCELTLPKKHFSLSLMPLQLASALFWLKLTIEARSKLYHTTFA